MMRTMPPDAAVRAEVLDPTRSFLVQAPAGAGKTELLIRRFLRLLALADEPEEVLAITFTRKAAAEMRERVLRALQAAADENPAGQAETQALARAVRARATARGWDLLRQPARLRIGTIDGLNASLARNAPLTGGASGLREITERPDECYAEAARQLLELIAEEGEHGEAVAALLGHLDNRPARLEALIAAQLAHRDQWLPVLGAGNAAGGELRQRLEASLRRVITARLRRHRAQWPEHLLAQARQVVDGAVACLGWSLPEGCDDLEAELAGWRFLGDVLLTKEGDWRKRLDARNGFPPAEPARKQAAMELLEVLRSWPALAGGLHAVRRLPSPRYPDSQWRALAALVRVLPLAAAQLRVVMAASGQTDYTEVAADALAALGTEELPGESALALDARVRHILMDEFQDTSQSQYALLAALTRGWSAGDGRTVFLVGDPMQSIYRFRQAEVRLFLSMQTQERRLPNVELNFRQLTANFRSVPAVVDWLNDKFRHVFPDEDDPVVGAVRYTPCEAVRGPEEDTGIWCHDFSAAEPTAEAERVAELVADAVRRWPEQTVGILVRSRAHAAETLDALHARGIPFLAVELLHLGDTTLAADLLALTRALTHPADRLAWLAVLRAPWCGLTLADLTALVEDDPRRLIPELLADPVALARLSEDGRVRVARTFAALGRARARRGLVALRDLVEGCWLELGGPAVAGRDLPHADALFDIIGAHDRGGDCPDVLALAEALSGQPVSLGEGTPRVQVLTIHKAKGLQFDTVIVPGLGRETRDDRRPALLWEELPGERGGVELLMAPINAAGTDTDPLYEFLWQLQREQTDAECDRLLYVAATRAVRRLHLLGACRTVGDAPAPPRKSLLGRLWRAVAADWRAACAGDLPPGEENDSAPIVWRQPPLRRLPADWQRPPPPPAVPWQAEEATFTGELLPFDWASHWAREAGTVVHRWLQHLAIRGIESVDAAFIRALVPRFRRELALAGVGSPDLERATRRVEAALLGVLEDEMGRWVLSGQHTAARNEWDLTVADRAGCRRLVVDRTFVTADGIRWIIDYKTGVHEGSDLEAFLATEVERYRDQLTRYRHALAALDDRPIRAALYYPLLRRLVIVGDDAPLPV